MNRPQTAPPATQTAPPPATAQGPGRGGFVPLPVRESGFAVPGDARGLAVTDLEQNGWPEFLVARNNDRALFFHNAGRAGARGAGVTLRGRAGNPAALGARLTLALADGSVQVAEKGVGPVFFAWPESNPPAQLKIRWPDGRVTEQTVATPPARALIFSAP